MTIVVLDDDVVAVSFGVSNDDSSQRHFTTKLSLALCNSETNTVNQLK